MASRLEAGDLLDQGLLLALHGRYLLALGDQGGPLRGQVGPRLGEAAEHVALGAHRVLHEHQPGGELVRALRLQHDRELAHAAVLVGRAGDPADQLVALADARSGWRRSRSARGRPRPWRPRACSPSSRSRACAATSRPCTRATLARAPGSLDSARFSALAARRSSAEVSLRSWRRFSIARSTWRLRCLGSAASAGATRPRHSAAITARVSAGRKRMRGGAPVGRRQGGSAVVSVGPGPRLRPWNGLFIPSRPVPGDAGVTRGTWPIRPEGT